MLKEKEAETTLTVYVHSGKRKTSDSELKEGHARTGRTAVKMMRGL